MADGVMWGLVVGFFIGVFSTMFAQIEFVEKVQLQDCAREHNIYACEFVAVPKQPDEVF